MATCSTLYPVRFVPIAHLKCRLVRDSPRQRRIDARKTKGAIYGVVRVRSGDSRRGRGGADGGRGSGAVRREDDPRRKGREAGRGLPPLRLRPVEDADPHGRSLVPRPPREGVRASGSCAPAGLPRRRHAPGPLGDRHDPGARLAGAVLQARRGSTVRISPLRRRPYGRPRRGAPDREGVDRRHRLEPLAAARRRDRGGPVLDERDGLLAGGAAGTPADPRRRADRRGDGAGVPASRVAGHPRRIFRSGSGSGGPGHRLDPEKPARSGRGEGPLRHEGPQGDRCERGRSSAAGGAREGRRGAADGRGGRPSRGGRAEAERRGAGPVRGGRRVLFPRGSGRPADADERSAHLFVRGRERRLPVHPRGGVRGGDRPVERGAPVAEKGRLHEGPVVHVHRSRGGEHRVEREAGEGGGGGIPDPRGGVSRRGSRPGRGGNGGEDQGADQPVRGASGMPDRRASCGRTDPRMGRRDQRRGEALHHGRGDSRLPDPRRDLEEGRRFVLLGEAVRRPDEEDPAFPFRPEGEGVHAGRRGAG